MPRKYGTGTVYPKPRLDGTVLYVGQWYDGKDAHGRRVRRTVTASTEAACWRAMADARRKPKDLRRRSGVTVEAILERWLDEYVKPTRRERTLIGYRSIVRTHLVPKWGSSDAGALTRPSIQRWINEMTASPVSIAHRVDCLSAALRWARGEGIISNNPTERLNLPRESSTTVPPMPPEAARALVEQFSDGTPTGDLVVVAIYTGMRQGEILGLRWEDIDFEHGLIRVTRSLSRLSRDTGIAYVLTETKTSRSRRTIPMVPAVRAVLERRRAQDGLVFPAADGGPADGPAVTRRFGLELKRRGLPPMRFHDLRHGFVSLLLSNGVSLAVVSDLAGHSSISTTVNIYGHLSMDSKVNAIAALAKALEE